MFDVVFTDHTIENYRDTLDRDKEKLIRFTNLLRDRGIFKNNAKYYVSTSHGEKEVEQTLEAWRSALQEL